MGFVDWSAIMLLRGGNVAIGPEATSLVKWNLNKPVASIPKTVFLTQKQRNREKLIGKYLLFTEETILSTNKIDIQ